MVLEGVEVAVKREEGASFLVNILFFLYLDAGYIWKFTFVKIL